MKSTLSSLDSVCEFMCENLSKICQNEESVAGLDTLTRRQVLLQKFLKGLPGAKWPASTPRGYPLDNVTKLRGGAK